MYRPFLEKKMQTLLLAVEKNSIKKKLPRSARFSSPHFTLFAYLEG